MSKKRLFGSLRALIHEWQTFGNAELAQLKREAEMLKQEVDMMRIHKERMQASQEGNILAHLRESLPKPERQARLNQETNQMAEQIERQLDQLGNQAAQIEEAATHAKMFGKTEELFNSIDLDKYLLDGTIQPAKLRRPPDYSPPGPAQSTSDHTSDQLPIQQVRPDTETNVRRITVAKVFVTRSDINDF